MSMSKSAQPYVVGGASACIASTAIHPIDVAKTRMQLYATQNPGAPSPGFAAMLRSMAGCGLRSMYVGLDASIMRQASYGTARIGLNRSFADQALAWYGGTSLPFGLKVASGMASGAVAVCIGTPMDLALVRLQADSMKPAADRRNYTGVVDALARIGSEEGIGALWKGVAPNILRGMAMNVGQLAIYDQAKEAMTKVFGDSDPKKPSMATKLSCAAIAGFTAAAFSLPFDLLKSRLQDQKPIGGAGGAMPYSGVADCAAKVVRAEGPLALWTGFSAYYARCAPHAMIILLAVEVLNPLYIRLANGAAATHEAAVEEPRVHVHQKGKNKGARVGLALGVNTSTNVFFADEPEEEVVQDQKKRSRFRHSLSDPVFHSTEESHVSVNAYELLRRNSDVPSEQQVPATSAA